MLAAVCTFLVFLATVPVFAGLYQFLACGLSYFATNLENVRPHLPRTAIVIPAWNEGAVIGTTIERLMKVNFPPERLRVYVIDDASNDETPLVTIEKAKAYPGRVIHVRRVAGGEGKAHTLNYGLDLLWKDNWTEAVLIMDADVIYTGPSIAKMARHLADPSVGAITGNIKEGSASPNYVQRFITFEYATATGASRRAQNVFGFLACLSGGAQLHSRENMMAIGGEIFSHTLAEDTFTTFRTQLNGRRALFEPNAVVYAEEPDSLVGLWKQRVRWGRGNVQITQVFRRLWFNARFHPSMGSVTMALIWFSIFLMPLFQISASGSLIVLYFLDAPLAWTLFRGLWIVAGIVYLVVTFASYVVDWESCRKAWFEGVVFPGFISLGVILYALWPPMFGPFVALIPEGGLLQRAGTLFLYAWLALAMLVSWSSMKLETSKRFQWAAAPVLYLAGYGPFLCAVTFGSYIKEITGASMTWDKTVKTGKVG